MRAQRGRASERASEQMKQHCMGIKSTSIHVDKISNNHNWKRFRSTFDVSYYALSPVVAPFQCIRYFIRVVVVVIVFSTVPDIMPLPFSFKKASR